MKKCLCFFSFCSLFCSCVKNFDPDLVGTTSDGKLIDEIFTVKGVSFTMKPVSGGTFEMGSLSGSLDEQPVLGGEEHGVARSRERARKFF